MRMQTQTLLCTIRNGIEMQVVEGLPHDAAGISRVAAQLTQVALHRAREEHATEASRLRDTIREREARIVELESRCESLYSEHTALAQDLLESHEDSETLAGQKAALASSVKQLADKVSFPAVGSSPGSSPTQLIQSCTGTVLCRSGSSRPSKIRC